MQMDTSKEIRIANLRALVTEFKTIEAVAQRARTPAVYLSQILNGVKSSTGTTRGVGNALARKLETGCGKKNGWLDKDNGAENSVANGKRPQVPDNFIDADELVKLIALYRQSNALGRLQIMDSAEVAEKSAIDVGREAAEN